MIRALIVGMLSTSFLTFPVGVFAESTDDAPVRALLVIGGCCHDYAQQKKLLTEGISARANVEWAVAYDADTTGKRLNPIYNNTDWAKGFDVVVHNECSADVSDLKDIDRVLKPHREGLPAVVLHCAMHSYRSKGWQDSMTPWYEFTGLQTTGHGPQAPIVITYANPRGPITSGLENWVTINEELYNNSTKRLLGTAHMLAYGRQDYQTRDGKQMITSHDVVVWTNLYGGKARVFGTTLGHQNATVADARYLDLVARGLLWAAEKLDAAHWKPARRVLIEPSPTDLP